MKTQAMAILENWLIQNGAFSQIGSKADALGLRKYFTDLNIETGEFSIEGMTNLVPDFIKKALNDDRTNSKAGEDDDESDNP